MSNYHSKVKIELAKDITVTRFILLLEKIQGELGGENEVILDDSVITINLSHVEVEYERDVEALAQRTVFNISNYGEKYITDIQFVRSLEREEEEEEEEEEDKGFVNPQFPSFTQEMCETLPEGTRVLMSFIGRNGYDERYGRIIDASYQKLTVMTDEPNEKDGQYHTLPWEQAQNRVSLDKESNRRWLILQQKQREKNWSWTFETLPSNYPDDADDKCFFANNYGTDGGSSTGTANNRREAIQKMYEYACIRGYIQDETVHPLRISL